jgi:hypothetical protein
MSEITSPIDVARANGRGVAVFRPDEAAAFLGISDVVIRDAMADYIRSSGKRGLAHFTAGKGALIRRCSLDTWMERQELKQAGA